MENLQTSWNSISTQPSEPLLSHAHMTSYSKSLMSYAQVYHQNAAEASGSQFRETC